MRLLIFAAALAVPASTPASPPRAPVEGRPAPAVSLHGKECRRPDVIQARPAVRPQAKALGELPPGDLMLAVYNQVDGCMEPVVVRYGREGRRP
jgi:hypothetical protein